jgi:hypothetical protein
VGSRLTQVETTCPPDTTLEQDRRGLESNEGPSFFFKGKGMVCASLS